MSDGFDCKYSEIVVPFQAGWKRFIRFAVNQCNIFWRAFCLHGLEECNNKSLIQQNILNLLWWILGTILQGKTSDERRARAEMPVIGFLQCVAQRIFHSRFHTDRVVGPG